MALSRVTEGPEEASLKDGGGCLTLLPTSAVLRNQMAAPLSKAYICFVVVGETLLLVKQIFRVERNIWVARMCQNQTDVCLLKTHF